LLDLPGVSASICYLVGGRRREISLIRYMALADYKSGDRLAGCYAVRRFERREYNGKPYLTMNLGDKSGSVNAIMWDGFAGVAEQIHPGVVVKIQGMMSEYRNQPQIRLERIAVAREHEYDLTELLPVSAIPVEQLTARLDSIIESIADHHLRQVAENVFADGDMRRDFLSTPGGQRWHHAYIGGLAEHTFGVVDICEFCARQYPELNRDLLICGAVLHDIGKVEQYRTSTVFEYTDSGRLLGHIVEGDEIVTDAIRQVEDFPREKELLLRHLILSHQGKHEHASPVVPMTREAFVLYYADELDSKLGALRKIAEKTGEAAWSEYIRLIDRYIYFSGGTEAPDSAESAAEGTAGGGED
jgi:3'-5' exoribonuclease